jgi:hypothetical protein
MIDDPPLLASYRIRLLSVEASNDQVHRARAIIPKSTVELRCAGSGATASWVAPCSRRRVLASPPCTPDAITTVTRAPSRRSPRRPSRRRHRAPSSPPTSDATRTATRSHSHPSLAPSPACARAVLPHPLASHVTPEPSASHTTGARHRRLPASTAPHRAVEPTTPTWSASHTRTRCHRRLAMRAVAHSAGPTSSHAATLTNLSAISIATQRSGSPGPREPAGRSHNDPVRGLRCNR